jgi:hypothetical protein
MALRRPRTLDVSDAVKTALVRLRRLEGVTTPPHLDLRAVADVEAELACELSDDVLSALAADVDDLRENAGMVLAEVVGKTRAAYRRGCSKDLVAIGRHPDGLAYYCVRRRAERDRGTQLIDFDTQDQSASPTSLQHWLETRVEARVEFLSEGDEQEQRRARDAGAEVGDEALRTFCPALVVRASDAPTETTLALRRVRHARFGTGELLREVNDGAQRKYEIRFPQVGTKLLLASAVEPVDEG